MKCEVLVGPIAIGEGRHEVGETIDLSPVDASLFERFKFVKILPAKEAPAAKAEKAAK